MKITDTLREHVEELARNSALPPEHEDSESLLSVTLDENDKLAVLTTHRLFDAYLTPSERRRLEMILASALQAFYRGVPK